MNPERCRRCGHFESAHYYTWFKCDECDCPAAPPVPAGPADCITGRRAAGDYGAMAHRVAWTKHVGPIPDGLCVLHRCDNPPCVNIAHLFLGTVAENNRDRTEKGRGRGPQGRPTGLDKCWRGHDYDEANTMQLPTRRVCRKCSVIRSRESYQRRKASA